MPFTFTENNNAIVISHSNGTSGITGATGATGNTGARGADGNPWAVGGGDPNNYTTFYDTDGNVISEQRNGDLYMDNVSGDVWEYSTTTGVWVKSTTITSRKGFPDGPDNFLRTEVIVDDTGFGYSVVKSLVEKIVCYIPFSGTYLAGTTQPTSVKLIISPNFGEPTGKVKITLNSTESGLAVGEEILASLDATIGGNTGEPVILSLPLTGNNFPSAPHALYLKAAYTAISTKNRNSYLGIGYIVIE